MNLKYIIPLVLLVFCSCKDDDVNPQDIPVGINDIEGRIACTNGMASIYPCDNYDLMGYLNLTTLDEPGLNDIWGWTDPTTSREYALIGGRSSTVFVDVTNPESLIIIGKLPSQSINSNWRDIKVYENHAYIVSEAADHGMQIFDLTRLRNPASNPITFDPDAVYTNFGNSHNIVINESSGFAYAVGTQTFSGGPHFIDITDPLNPQPAGGYDASGYTHDAQVVTYNGPDSDYTGREILLASNENEVTIVDVTDKENPSLISTVNQDNVGYIHQGWFDSNHAYFYANDELDETQFGFNSRTLVFDLTDLDNPQYSGPYFGPSQAIDHNLYVNNNELFLSNYTDGLRVADISNSTPETMVDIGYFDTFPESDATEFNGVWSVYPYFSSGNIVLSDITGGLFVIRKSGS